MIKTGLIKLSIELIEDKDMVEQYIKDVFLGKRKKKKGIGAHRVWREIIGTRSGITSEDFTMDLASIVVTYNEYKKPYFIDRSKQFKMR